MHASCKVFKTVKGRMLFLHIELLEHCLVARVRFIMAFFKCKVSDKRLNNQDFDKKIFSCFTTDFLCA